MEWDGLWQEFRDGNGINGSSWDKEEESYEEGYDYGSSEAYALNKGKGLSKGKGRGRGRG